ncbi:uncharacterized protein EAF02_000268 [Botrytis sinoallii]|uniref:uncharacterized protein n=1 Tax=Botrytis sinoallii TaxID=1463999 RepID=UPI0019024B26|nr:uncharacterized protein EAF02_000268 [Botrytis sinoallii]KAF7892730.1 hypothetical protein EAF02_000268 [Botrytis sinoallii]
MSEKADSSELVHKHAGTSSDTSEQEIEIPLTQQEHTEPFVLSDIQADDSIDNDTTLTVGWPSSPTMENQADAVAADWSDRNDDPQDDMEPTAVGSTDTEAEDWDNVPTTDDGSWEYMPPREATFTEFDSVRQNQAGELRINDPTMWRGYSGTWSSKKKEVKDYLDWNGFDALEIRPVNSIVILGCRIDTEILPELFDHLLQRLRETTNEMKMGSPELFLNIVREEFGSELMRYGQERAPMLRLWYLSRDQESS